MALSAASRLAASNVSSFGKGVAELLQARFVFRHEIFFRGFGVVIKFVAEIKTGVSGQFAEQFEFALAGVERGLDVGQGKRVGIHAGFGKGVDGEFVKAVAGQFARVFALQPEELFVIEPRVVPENLRQVEAFDDFGAGQFFAIVLGRPAEQAEIIDDAPRAKSLRPDSW